MLFYLILQSIQSHTLIRCLLRRRFIRCHLICKISRLTVMPFNDLQPVSQRNLHYTVNVPHVSNDSYSSCITEDVLYLFQSLKTNLKNTCLMQLKFKDLFYFSFITIWKQIYKVHVECGWILYIMMWILRGQNLRNIVSLCVILTLAFWHFPYH